jgi:hypothetical protein
MSDPKPRDYTMRNTKRITRTLFVSVLERAKSPAAPVAADCYDICLSAGLDPAIALAFFQHESTYGKAGRAVTTLNWGNLRKGRRAYKHEGGFAHYRDYRESLRDWCDLINGPIYIGAGRTTVRSVIPIYAPSSDNNKPERYIQAVLDAVYQWSQAIPLPDPPTPDRWALWGDAYPLPEAERTHGIPALWHDNAPWLGAATGPETYPDARTAFRPFVGGWIVYDSVDDKATLGRRVKV